MSQYVHNKRLSVSAVSDVVKYTENLYRPLCGPGTAVDLMCVCVRTITIDRNDL